MRSGQEAPIARHALLHGYAAIQPEDIAELVFIATRLPPHVDVSRLEVFPTGQAVGGARIVKAG